MTLKSKYVNYVKSPISLGIVQFNSLALKDKTVSCVIRSISLGIEEVKLLNSKFKYVNCVKSPISLGIVEPVVFPSKRNVDWQVVKLGMERNLHASCLAAKVGTGDGALVGFFVVGAVVGTEVGGDNDELLGADGGRLTNSTAAPTRPHANKARPEKINRYKGCGGRISF